jgi:hypothetical protein
MKRKLLKRIIVTFGALFGLGASTTACEYGPIMSKDEIEDCCHNTDEFGLYNECMDQIYGYDGICQYTKENIDNCCGDKTGAEQIDCVREFIDFPYIDCRNKSEE